MGGCGLDCAGSGWIRVAGCCEISGGLLWTWWRAVVNSMAGCCELNGGLLWSRWRADMNSVECCCEISGVLLWTQWRAAVKSVVGCCEISDRFIWTLWRAVLNPAINLIFPQTTGNDLNVWKAFSFKRENLLHKIRSIGLRTQVQPKGRFCR